MKTTADNNPDLTMADRIRAESAKCLRAARAEGFDGLDSEFELTKYDIEYMLSALGRKPTSEEWADAGFHYVGSELCSDTDDE